MSDKWGLWKMATELMILPEYTYEQHCIYPTFDLFLWGFLLSVFCGDFFFFSFSGLNCNIGKANKSI